ncbi:MAG: Crp/Fnr family transcriptional regulator [Pseudoxanthomonas sp.]
MLIVSQSAPMRFGNRLLDQLPDDASARLAPDLKHLTVAAGDVLYASQSLQPYLFFPNSGIVSVFHDLADGEGGAIATIGNEGASGYALMLSGQRAPTHTVIQLAGEGVMLKADAFHREFHRGDAFQQLLLRYILYRISEMGQIAICNRHHSVEEQLCRLLLLYSTRSGLETLHLTHESIASLLGVRREGVSRSVHRLQQAELISSRYGLVQIIDPKGLEQHSCECYRAILEGYKRIVARPLAV